MLQAIGVVQVRYHDFLYRPATQGAVSGHETTPVCRTESMSNGASNRPSGSPSGWRTRRVRERHRANRFSEQHRVGGIDTRQYLLISSPRVQGRLPAGQSCSITLGFHSMAIPRAICGAALYAPCQRDHQQCTLRQPANSFIREEVSVAEGCRQLS